MLNASFLPHGEARSSMAGRVEVKVEFFPDDSTARRVFIRSNPRRRQPFSNSPRGNRPAGALSEEMVILSNRNQNQHPEAQEQANGTELPQGNDAPTDPLELLMHFAMKINPLNNYAL